jgi:hypothetical protein
MPSEDYLTLVRDRPAGGKDVLLASTLRLGGELTLANLDSRDAWVGRVACAWGSGTACGRWVLDGRLVAPQVIFWNEECL